VKNHCLKIGKKKTAIKKVKATRENKFDHNITSINDHHVFRKILPYTNGMYKTQVNL